MCMKLLNKKIIPKCVDMVVFASKHVEDETEQSIFKMHILLVCFCFCTKVRK